MKTKTPAMTFHESYGHLPKAILTLIKRYNVSPADYDLMTDLLGNVAYVGNGVIHWSVIEQHILDNSPKGYYTGRSF